MKTQAETDSAFAAASEAIDQLTTEGLEWRRRAEAAEAALEIRGAVDEYSAKFREERDIARQVLKETIGELLPETECAPGCDSYGHAEDCRVYSVLAEFRAMRKERDEARAESRRKDAQAGQQYRLAENLRAEVERLKDEVASLKAGHNR